MTFYPTQTRFAQRQGAIMILIAFAMVAIFIVAACAINLAYMDLSNTQLQIATDAAARAAVREYTNTGSETAAKNAGISIAAQNDVAGIGLQLKSSDFQFGNANRTSINSKYLFGAGLTPKNAVRVSGNRNASSLGGSIPLFFGSFIGQTHYSASEFATATQSELDIVFVLDRSGSMAFQPAEESNGKVTPAADLNGNGVWDPGEWSFGDPPPIPGDSRWEGVVNAVNIFLTELGKTKSIERISLVSFSSSATLELDFSDNYGAVMSKLNTVSPKGTTAIGDGINLGTSVLLTSPNHRSFTSKVMIVLTDGQNNTGSDPIVAAQNAANQGITIHTVSFTSFGSTWTMEQVANIGGGRFEQAIDNATLKEVFKHIFQSLPVLLIE